MTRDLLKRSKLLRKSVESTISSEMQIVKYKTLFSPYKMISSCGSIY